MWLSTLTQLLEKICVRTNVALTVGTAARGQCCMGENESCWLEFAPWVPWACILAALYLCPDSSNLKTVFKLILQWNNQTKTFVKAWLWVNLIAKPHSLYPVTRLLSLWWPHGLNHRYKSGVVSQRSTWPLIMKLLSFISDTVRYIVWSRILLSVKY